jgi:hypothetical protein
MGLVDMWGVVANYAQVEFGIERTMGVVADLAQV